jgi:hypothetical protein
LGPPGRTTVEKRIPGKARAASRSRNRLKQCSLESSRRKRGRGQRPGTQHRDARKGEGVEGLPGSQSVARAQADARNRGGPGSPCRTNCEGQAGRAAQRQEAPSGIPGVGSVHSIQWQGARPDTGEGADVLAKLTQETRAVRMTEPTGQPPCERRERVNTKSPVRENRPPGSVRGAPGNRCPYLDKC